MALQAMLAAAAVQASMLGVSIGDAREEVLRRLGPGDPVRTALVYDVPGRASVMFHFAPQGHVRSISASRPGGRLSGKATDPWVLLLGKPLRDLEARLGAPEETEQASCALRVRWPAGPGLDIEASCYQG